MKSPNSASVLARTRRNKLGLAVAATALAAAAAIPQYAFAQDGVVATSPDGPFSTGFYVGANLGAAFNPGVNNISGDGFTSQVVSESNTFLANDAHGSAITGGLLAGWRYRWNSVPIITGIETDFNGLGNFEKHNSGTFTSTGSGAAPAGTYAVTLDRDTNYFGTVRGHLGYVIDDRAEVYISGGFAYAGNSGAGNGSVTYTSTSGEVTHFVGSGNGHVDTGAAYGLGAEYAMTPNLIGRVEYLYVDLKNVKTNYFPYNGASYYAVGDISEHVSVLRVAVMYKF